MLITEPQLMCDHCHEQINKGEFVSFVYQGEYEWVDDNDEAVISRDTEKVFHFHLTCYDERSSG